MSDLRAAVERLPGFGLVPEKYRLGQGDDGLVHRAAVLALIDAAPPPPLDASVLARLAYADRPPIGKRPVPWTPVMRRHWMAWAERIARAYDGELPR